MELMLVSMVANKEVSSVLVELLMLVTERVTEVIDTTSDSIEVEVNETATASTNIVILLMRVTSSTDSPPELELLVPDRIDVTNVVTSVKDFLLADNILHSARTESSAGTSLLPVLTPSGSAGSLPAPKISSSLASLPVIFLKSSCRDVTSAVIFTERASILSFEADNDVVSVSVTSVTLAVTIVRAMEVILTERKST